MGAGGILFEVDGGDVLKIKDNVNFEFLNR